MSQNINNCKGLRSVIAVAVNATVPSGISQTVFLRVFNRYGQLVFETNQYLKGWDGTFKGKPLGQGSYVWMVKGNDRNNRSVEMSGTIMLIR